MKKLPFIIIPFSITNGEPEFNYDKYIELLSLAKINSHLFTFSLNDVCYVHLANLYFNKLSHFYHHFILEEDSKYDRVEMGFSYLDIKNTVETYKHDPDFVTISDSEKYVFIFISPYICPYINVEYSINLMSKTIKQFSI